MNYKLKTSVIVGLLATVYDQIYHILFNLPHAITTQLPNTQETHSYIISKFIVVAIVIYLAMWFVRHVRSKILIGNNLIIFSIVVSITAALIFGYVMNVYYPYGYSDITHLSHAIVIFLALYLYLKNYRG